MTNYTQEGFHNPSPLERGRSEVLSIGIIGGGGFARFAAKAFLKIPGVKIVAITDINEKALSQIANDFNAKAYVHLEAFFQDKNIDLVYIATPPFLHYEQSKQALLAGKHVICEKPAALKTSEAEELQALAASSKLLYVVNLMQRYNPLYQVVKTIVEEKMLGNFLHGFFENYASDETLNVDHWFWDKEKSGGIFIEHGVHFFDMFSGWLGEGKVISALQLHRAGTQNKLTDCVQATVLYKDRIVNFYHGFDQPNILDRQELRLQFEKGEITLYEWIPVKMKLHGLFQDEQLKTLQELLGEFSITPQKEEEAKKSKIVKGRFTNIPFDHHVTIEYGSATEKQNRYQQMVTAMLQDQWNWIRNSEYTRLIDDTNAVESLRMAEQATQLARHF